MKIVTEESDEKGYEKALDDMLLSMGRYQLCLKEAKGKFSAKNDKFISSLSSSLQDMKERVEKVIFNRQMMIRMEKSRPFLNEKGIQEKEKSLLQKFEEIAKNIKEL